MSRRILLLSGSKVYGGSMLEWAEDIITTFLKKSNVTTVLFVPYAGFDYDEYTAQIKCRFNKMGFEVEGIHELGDPVHAVEKAEAIFVGGGNTFKLLDELYKNNIITAIRNQVENGKMPYIGSSAGSNVAACNICTTNDMPIIYPPTFKALNLVNFNINPHYIDADPSSKHMGETRETRIQEYHKLCNTPVVLGLREGCALLIQCTTAHIVGCAGAKLFKRNEEPQEYPPNTEVSFLLNME